VLLLDLLNPPHFFAESDARAQHLQFHAPWLDLDVIWGTLPSNWAARAPNFFAPK